LERERVRESEPVQLEEGAHYAETLRQYSTAREHAKNGKIVIRAKDLPWRQGRQGYSKRYLNWHKVADGAVLEAATQGWTCFIQHVKTHSGKHRHQGGIQLFVLEGEGYTTVNGKKVDWEKWDLIILPVQPNGCEHQHFNKSPGTPAKWMAFRYHPFSEVLGNMFEHVEDSPDWIAKQKAASTQR